MSLALPKPEATYAHGGTKLQRFRPLTAGQVKRLLETPLSLYLTALGISRRRPPAIPTQQELAAQAMDLRRRGTLLMLLNERLGFRNKGEPWNGTPHISVHLGEQGTITWQTGPTWWKPEARPEPVVVPIIWLSLCEIL
jgi:hypothetical protein